ncbi:MAG: hypothetical protein QXS06_00010 [Desulfurococcaceae archaeon]
MDGETMKCLAKAGFSSSSEGRALGYLRLEQLDVSLVPLGLKSVHDSGVERPMATVNHSANAQHALGRLKTT